MVRSFRYRLKLMRTLRAIEDEITELVEKGGGEIISGNFNLVILSNSV